MHYPGWCLELLRCLYEARKITASGHETTDTDPGIATTKTVTQTAEPTVRGDILTQS